MANGGVLNLEQLKIKEILEATGGKLLKGSLEEVVKNISTDSRNIEKYDLFIPIVGEKFDGHTYINQAVLKGATAVLTEKDLNDDLDAVVIKVEDTKKAYLDIARAYRKKFNIPFIGVVGSVGKTSTKDMIASVLSTNMNVLKTEGNFNNEIGVPITLLRLEKANDVAILEMGMNNFGEISRLTSAVLPNYVVISNIGVSHIENLGSRENILKAKLEVLEGLDKNGIVFINNDDDMLQSVLGKIPFKTITYGIENECDYRAINIKNNGEEGVTFDIVLDDKTYHFKINALGRHNVYNALSAIALARSMNISINDIIEGVSNFKSGKMRLNIEDRGKYRIINDSYNASTDSMKASIDVLESVSKDKRSIAVLGDMLEMGDYAPSEHTKVGDYINNKDIDCVITVGNNSKYIAKPLIEKGHSNVYSFNDNKETLEFLKKFIQQDDIILFKASRGMKLEEIINGLKDDI